MIADKEQHPTDNNGNDAKCGNGVSPAVGGIRLVPDVWLMIVMAHGWLRSTGIDCCNSRLRLMAGYKLIQIRYIECLQENVAAEQRRKEKDDTTTLIHGSEQERDCRVSPVISKLAQADTVLPASLKTETSIGKSPYSCTQSCMKVTGFGMTPALLA